MDPFSVLSFGLGLGSEAFKRLDDTKFIELCEVKRKNYSRTFNIAVARTGLDDRNFDQTSTNDDINPANTSNGGHPELRFQRQTTIQISVDESAHGAEKLFPDLKHGTGFKSVTSQWLQECPDEWYMLKSFDFSTAPLFGDPWNLGKRPLGIVRTIRERLRDPDRKWARVRRRITTRREQDGSLQVFISCKTMVHESSVTDSEYTGNLRQQQASCPFTLTAAFVAELRKLEDLYCSMRDESNWKVLFLLQYQHANLNVFAEFLEDFATAYVEPRSHDFDPRSSKLRRWVLREMARDSYQYRELTNIGNEMTDTLESLLDVAKDLVADQSISLGHLHALEPALRGCCKDIRRRLVRLTEEMESSLRFLELARSMRQANDVELLTILAAIFLPLSLAAGVLSMQSRFKDLGVLIYDFFGVVSLLATAAIVILVIILVWDFVQEKASRIMTERLLKPVWRILTTVARVGSLLFGAVILSSFLVGMFKDVVLGAKILGYGIAGAIGSLMVIQGINFQVWLRTSLSESDGFFLPWSLGLKVKGKDVEGGLQNTTSQQHMEPPPDTQHQREPAVG